jgi:4-hydroxy-tetrahydrodipicolinate synthase
MAPSRRSSPPRRVNASSCGPRCSGDHASAHDLHRRLLPLWNAMVGDNLPACTKYAQILQGCPGGQPRAPMPAASAAQQRAIRAALAGVTSARAAAE